MKKSDRQSSIKGKKKLFPSKSKMNKLYTFVIVCLVIGSIIAIFSITFFPSTDEGFSELMLLTYDPAEEEYEAEVYPIFIYRTRDISIYFVVKNFENKVAYYQLQVKATKLSQNVSTVFPLPTNSSFLMYSNNTYEKILPPATNAEKKESGKIEGDYIWSPTIVNLYMNLSIDLMLNWESNVKIVFELWKFNTLTESFQYTGVFTFLELLIRVS